MLGIIGGTGIYGISEILQDTKKIPAPVTPFGRASCDILVGSLRAKPEQKLAFIARHGEHHSYLPSEVPYAANIYALKELGVKTVIAFAAVGSLQEEYKPGDFVLPTQFIDRTRSPVRVSTFFGRGCVAHVSVADPTSLELTKDIMEIVRTKSDIELREVGPYVCIEGPAYSTRAESEIYRSWGGAVVGMTNLSEAKLAREAEMAYVSISMVTDYDCWRKDEEAVTSDAVVEVMKKNGEKALKLVKLVASELDYSKVYPEHSALKGALVSKREFIPEATMRDLEIICGKYV